MFSILLLSVYKKNDYSYVYPVGQPLELIFIFIDVYVFLGRTERSSVVRAFAHGAMGRPIDPSWWTH